MRNLRQSIAPVILLCAALVTCTAAATEGATYYVAVSSTSYANVREQPSARSKVITTLERGAEVSATGERDGLWMEVQTDSVNITYHGDGTTTQSDPLKGWIKLSLLSMEQPYSNKSGTIKGDGRVRLRDEPGGDFMKWVYPGDDVSVLSVVELDGQQWYRIRHSDDRGWIMADYLDLS